jgi:hypothetical protein
MGAYNNDEDNSHCILESDINKKDDSNNFIFALISLQI